MLEFILDFLKEFGPIGLYISLAVESSSVPFPGTIVALVYGYLLNPSVMDAVWISLLASFVYTVFSFIPYGIGYKLEEKIKRKWNRKKIEKAQSFFNRFGQWSISFSRVLGIGNYISYAAGISKVKPVRFGILTYVGILPWLYVMLLLGQAGQLDTVTNFLSSAQKYIVGGIILLIISYLIYRYMKKRNKKSAGSHSQSRETCGS
ncbi:DedA family protein [Virgibacillus ihumii]|uniref:DedA family protein n=1 Tax=Virgibacillus ihumii TaxID=2686091 RepID=UPI00157C38F4|nr:VTT domain-containing protein [Virgibacillus ihumii]